jgi:hypothetical protein
MPSVGFEPTIPASARLQTHALDRATTGIGHEHCTREKKSMPPVGFEPTIPASAGLQTHALDGAATGVGHVCSALP